MRKNNMREGLIALALGVGLLFSQSGYTAVEAIWFFDEGQGQIAGDSSNNHNDGSLENLSGDLTWDVWEPNGRLSKCLCLNNPAPGSADQFITVPNSASLNITANTMSLEAWLSPYTELGTGRGTLDWMNILSKGAYGLFFSRASGTISGIVNVDGVSKEVKTVVSWGAGEWHHVAMSYDGKGNTLYIDGVLKDKVPASGSINDSSDKNLTIGAAVNGHWGWSGRIDQVRVMSGALTGQEIADSCHSSELEVAKAPTALEIKAIPGVNFDYGQDVALTAAVKNKSGETISERRFVILGTGNGALGETAAGPFAPDAGAELSWKLSNFEPGPHRLRLFDAEAGRVLAELMIWCRDIRGLTGTAWFCSDIQGEGADEVISEAILDLQKSNVNYDAVVLLGDAIEGGITNEQAKKRWEIIKESKKPVYFLSGNHEWDSGDNRMWEEAQSSPLIKTAASKNDSWYAENIFGYQFVFLNTPSKECDGGIEPGQGPRIRQYLEEHSKTPAILLGHFPLPKVDYPRREGGRNYHELLPLSSNVVASFYGHWHLRAYSSVRSKYFWDIWNFNISSLGCEPDTMGHLSESAIVDFYTDRIAVRFRNHTQGRWFTRDDLIVSTTKGNPHAPNRLEAPAVTFFLPPELKPWMSFTQPARR